MQKHTRNYEKLILGEFVYLIDDIFHAYVKGNQEASRFHLSFRQVMDDVTTLTEEQGYHAFLDSFPRKFDAQSIALTLDLLRNLRTPTAHPSESKLALLNREQLRNLINSHVKIPLHRQRLQDLLDEIIRLFTSPETPLVLRSSVRRQKLGFNLRRSNR